MDIQLLQTCIQHIQQMAKDVRRADLINIYVSISIYFS